MKYHEVEHIATVAYRSQWPENDLPEIIFAGRSNAGKSSLINSLTNRKNLAYTASKPGKTQLLNFFKIDNRVVFTDAPGYGFAKGGRKAYENFGKLIEPYFNEREQLIGLVLVLDIRRKPNDDDLAMVEFARANHLPVIAACVKSDKLSRNQQFNQIQIITKTLGISKQSAVVCSSTNKTGIDDVWNAIDEMVEKRTIVVDE